MPETTNQPSFAGNMSDQRVFVNFYTELRRLASKYFRGERVDHTLQPTALVHELWVKLAAQKLTKTDDPKEFFLLSARMMRQVLIDHARKRNSEKRGSGQTKEQYQDELAIQLDDQSVSLTELENALVALSKVSERATKVVEMRVFGGFSNLEIAQLLDSSEATVKRDWALAKAFLESQLVDKGNPVG